MNLLNSKIYYILLIIVVMFYNCSSSVVSVNDNDILEIKSIKGNSSVETLVLLDNELLKTDLSKSKIALIYLKKGNLLSILQKDKEAVNSYKLALPLFKLLNDESYIAETYWHLGSSYAFLSKKVIAIEYLLKALKINKIIKDYKLEANIYGSLAHVHFLYKDFEKSINYALSAIEIQKNNKDSLGLSATYNNMAVIYKNIHQYEEAIIYNTKSLELNQLLQNKSAIAKSYNNLGQVFEKNESNSKAIRFYNKAIALNDSLKNANTSAIRNLANLYLAQKETLKAKQLFLQAVKIEVDNNKIGVQKNMYDKLLEIALQDKDFKESLLFQRKRDSLANLKNNFENNEKLKLLEIQYQLANKKNELQKKIQQNRISKLILGVVFILLIVFALLLAQFLKNKRLKNQKDKIQLEQQVLRSQMNPHFIFNALSAIQDSLLNNEPIKSASYLSKFAKLIRQNFDFINEKTILLANEIDALQNYMDTQKMRYSEKFDYEINIFADVDINTIEIPPLLIQPFIENAIEHGFKNIKKKGKIILNISKNKGYICYEIKDNGKGINNTNNDGKQHSIDVFKKRLALLDDNSKNSFKINSTNSGTTIYFCIKE